MGELRDDRRARLDKALEKLPARIDAGGEVIDGHPAEVLAAESERLDLLVIGSRGYGALRATLVGSVAHELAGTSRCPVLLVPRGVDRPLDGLARRPGTGRPPVSGTRRRLRASRTGNRCLSR